MEVTARRPRWRVQIFQLILDVALRAGAMPQAANELSKLRTDGQEATHLDDDLLVCNVENIQVATNETLHVHVLHGMRRCEPPEYG